MLSSAVLAVGCFTAAVIPKVYAEDDSNKIGSENTKIVEEATSETVQKEPVVIHEERAENPTEETSNISDDTATDSDEASNNEAVQAANVTSTATVTIDYPKQYIELNTKVGTDDQLWDADIDFRLVDENGNLYRSSNDIRSDNVLEDMKLDASNRPSIAPDGKALLEENSIIKSEAYDKADDEVEGFSYYWDGSEWTVSEEQTSKNANVISKDIFSSTGCYKAYEAYNDGKYYWKVEWNSEGTLYTIWTTHFSDKFKLSGDLSNHVYFQTLNYRSTGTLYRLLKGAEETGKIELSGNDETLKFIQASRVRIITTDNGSKYTNFSVHPFYTIMNGRGQYWDENSSEWKNEYSIVDGQYPLDIRTVTNDVLSISEVQTPYEATDEYYQGDVNSWTYGSVGNKTVTLNGEEDSKVVDYPYERSNAKVDLNIVTKNGSDSETAKYILTDSEGRYLRISEKEVFDSSIENTTTSQNVFEFSEEYSEFTVTTNSTRLYFFDGINNYTAGFLMLPEGTYTLKEVSAPDGYGTLNTDVTFTVDKGIEKTLDQIVYEKNPTVTLTLADADDASTQPQTVYAAIKDSKGRYLVEYTGQNWQKAYAFVEDTPMDKVSKPTTNPIGDQMNTKYDGSCTYFGNYIWNGTEWLKESNGSLPIVSSTGMYQGSWQNNGHWDSEKNTYVNDNYYFFCRWVNGISTGSAASIRIDNTISSHSSPPTFPVNPGNYEILILSEPTYSAGWKKQNYLPLGKVDFTVNSGEDKTVELSYHRQKRIKISATDAADATVVPQNQSVIIKNENGQYMNSSYRFVDDTPVDKSNKPSEAPNGREWDVPFESGYEFNQAWNGTEWVDADQFMSSTGCWMAVAKSQAGAETSNEVYTYSLEWWNGKKVTGISNCFGDNVYTELPFGTYTISAAAVPTEFKDLVGNVKTCKYADNAQSFTVTIDENTSYSNPPEVTFTYDRVLELDGFPETGSENALILSICGYVALLAIGTIFIIKKNKKC